MNDIKKIVLNNGLKCTLVLKKGFTKKYAGIAVNYGSNDFKFEMDNQEYITKSGIAHFIEHKLFELPDGTDAFMKLSNLGAESNAYTSNNRTCYFIQTSGEFYEPLNVLLDFVFTPCFEPKSVEREKGIIVSEIEMYEDDPDSVLELEILKNLYDDSTLAIDVAGSKEDVRSTTNIDMLNNYKAFYQTNNMALVIVGDFEEKAIISYLNNYLTKFIYESHNVKSLNNISNSKIKNTNSTIYNDIEKDKIGIGIKFKAPTNFYKDTIAYECFINSLFSESSKIYQDLIEENIVLPSFVYQTESQKEYRFLLLQTETTNPDLTIKRLNEIIDNVKVEDITKESVDSYLKMRIGQLLRAFDNVNRIGDLILQNELSNIDFNELIKCYKEITYEDILKFLNIMKDSPRVSVKMLRK